MLNHSSTRPVSNTFGHFIEVQLMESASIAKASPPLALAESYLTIWVHRHPSDHVYMYPALSISRGVSDYSPGGCPTSLQMLSEGAPG